MSESQPQVTYVCSELYKARLHSLTEVGQGQCIDFVKLFVIGTVVNRAVINNNLGAHDVLMTPQQNRSNRNVRLINSLSSFSNATLKLRTCIWSEIEKAQIK